jgi:hypothetical protein
MYKATAPHQGAGNHLETYINQTVRTGSKPSAEGLKKHIADKYKKMVDKLKTPAAQGRKEGELNQHIKHIDDNKEHYDNLLTMHHHLQQAKNVLVNALNQHQGDFEHHLEADGQHKETGPEGFVVHHGGQPTKLVNRAEFARANLLKVRGGKPEEKKPVTENKKVKEYDVGGGQKLSLKKGDHHPDTHVLTHKGSDGKKRIAATFAHFSPDELKDHLKEFHGLD